MPVQTTALPRRIGLTGGIGSGKSTVGGFLAALGAALIDADQIARATTAAGGAAMPAIRAAFGDPFVDSNGALDRARMRAHAFTDPQARAQLEGIIHPLVTLHSAQAAQDAERAGAPLIVFDIPLLAESGRWARRLDAVLVVDCPEEVQIERVIRRNGLQREVVQGIIRSQATRTARLSVADAVLFNGADCSLEALHGRTREVGRLFGL